MQLTKKQRNYVTIYQFIMFSNIYIYIYIYIYHTALLIVSQHKYQDY